VQVTDTSFASGRYVVERVLGKGGQKIVYLVKDVRLERPCALSLLGERPHAEDSARLDNEARALALAGAHPNVVTVYDVGEDGGRPFIVSEYVPGGDLAGEVQRAGGMLPVARATALARDLLRALAHVHECGIVHRDLKPTNVWIGAEGTPKIGDFGLALRADHERLTAANGIVGTPSYLAPEQIGNGAIDGRTDLYALGCLLYEILTGRPPFSGTMPAVIAQHLHAVPAPLSVEGLPPKMAALVQKLLAKSPNDRPASAVEALALLEQVLAEHSSVRNAVVTVAPQYAGPNKPSIAVLPFQSPADPVLGEGLAEDTIVSLSKFRSLFVIARNASFRFRSDDLARIKTELGVHYVVDGRVRKGGDRILISVELIRAEDGRDLWAERFDRPMAELFQVQEEVTRTIVATLVNRVEAARLEEVRRAPTERLAAYDFLLRGRDHHHRQTLEDNARAQELIKRAIELDPNYALAHAWFACCIGQCYGLGGPVPQDMDPFEMLARSHALDPDEPELHRIYAAMYLSMRRYDESQAHNEKGLALNPNDDRIVCQRGEILTYLGRAQEALEWIRSAMRLNPFYSDSVRSDLARALYCTGQWTESLQTLQRIATPRVAHRAYMASCHLQLGDRTAAERTRDDLLAANRGFQLDRFLASLLFRRAEDRAGLERDLRALGLS
jgi:serine/threonine protein kinase/Tfp pilus assembly protein PilF